eukprot:63986-Rhodomonas_salina.1
MLGSQSSCRVHAPGACSSRRPPSPPSPPPVPFSADADVRVIWLRLREEQATSVPRKGVA